MLIFTLWFGILTPLPAASLLLLGLGANLVAEQAEAQKQELRNATAKLVVNPHQGCASSEDNAPHCPSMPDTDCVGATVCAVSSCATVSATLISEICQSPIGGEHYGALSVEFLQDRTITPDPHPPRTSL
jgi:hypothetical protein